MKHPRYTADPRSAGGRREPWQGQADEQERGWQTVQEPGWLAGVGETAVRREPARTLERLGG